jgi:magnesium chelatase family protein
MSLAVLSSRALAGMQAPQVTVEVHLANGLPSFTIVGLPETEVKESRDRVRAALQNAGFEFPARRITVNLAPADLPKESGHRLVTTFVNHKVSSTYGHFRTKFAARHAGYSSAPTEPNLSRMRELFSAVPIYIAFAA